MQMKLEGIASTGSDDDLLSDGDFDLLLVLDCAPFHTRVPQPDRQERQGGGHGGRFGDLGRDNRGCATVR